MIVRTARQPAPGSFENSLCTVQSVGELADSEHLVQHGIIFALVNGERRGDGIAKQPKSAQVCCVLLKSTPLQRSATPVCNMSA